MEPPIQYARTADGVSIAFWTLGEGMPLVHMPAVGYSHIQLEWQMPGWRAYYQRLADKRKLIRYDGRGTGLSERRISDFSLDAHLLDLEAVVDRLALERFTLLGVLHTGPVGMTYAARHPERVSHLILWCTYARAADYVRSSPQLQAVRALMDKDWVVYTETLAHVMSGWSAGEEARRLAAFLRECTTPQSYRAAFRATTQFDVTALLPQVQCPTLVLHRRQMPYPVVDLARDLAARISDARLVVLEGTAFAPWQDGMDLVLAAIDDFLGEGEEAAAPPAPFGLVTVLFTDMEGSTSLTQRLGDAGAQELVDTHNRIVREALAAHGGSEIKHTGDGIMASFPLASGAIECAVAVQRAVAAWNASLPAHPEPVEGRAGGGVGPAPEPIGVRVGLNAGEPVAKERDLFGTAVQLARRVCDHARPGQVLVSDVVRSLAAGKGFLFADTGEVTLKGFEEPVRLYEVRWREEG